MGLSAVIVCCARSCGRDLPAVLKNIEAISSLYERPAYVFVENDSTDDTKAQLQAWLKGRPDADLIELDGLAERLPRRTERLAVCRNAYLEHIRQAGYADRDHLVIFDADEVNAGPIRIEEYARARDWLASHDETAAIFSNADPFYYDLLALRHPTWCPMDFQAEVQQRDKTRFTKDEARQAYCYDRQVPVAPDQDPIEVQSAFGGFAIYRLAPALEAEYVGINAAGQDVCEHVPFNANVARQSHGRLFILPWLRNRASTGINVPLSASRKIHFEQGGAHCDMLAPTDHKIDQYRAVNPLYDRRLPVLSRLIGDAAPGAAALDVGANIGDTIALCRLEGCQLHFVAIEASLAYYKFLAANRARSPNLFRDVTPVWSFVGRPGDSPEVEQRNGTAHRVEGAAPTTGDIQKASVSSLRDIADALAIPAAGVALVKIDTDGYDQAIILNDWEFLKASAPVLWTEAQISTPDQEADWRRILEGSAAIWPYVVAFDNYGFAYCAGRTAEKHGSCLDLISYARRHRALPKKRFGSTPVYYPDLALFPERFAGVFQAFCRTLDELNPLVGAPPKRAPEMLRPTP
jgi:FkbM family methyltransferase